MTDDDIDPRIEAILEQWFLLRDAGEEADPIALCGEDPDLAAALQAVLDREETALVEELFRPPPEVPSDLPRERIGDFRLLGSLGAGGMGAVYLAEQESLAREVALKVLGAHALADPRMRLRFRREAEVAAALDHPNLVPVYAIGEDDGLAYIAMKHLSGPSLSELRGTMSPKEAAEIGAALARGLDAAHVTGVVHRDVKPANVLLDKGVPVLVDFGLARAQSHGTLTREGSAPGTLPYMPPEALQLGTAALDPRADIYGLGATLYELVAGRPPFPSADPKQLMHAILHVEAPRLRLKATDRDFETILLRALRKEPHLRFATAAEFAEDLQSYLDGRPIASRPTAWWTRSWKLARRHRRAAGLLAAACMLVLALSAKVAWDSWQESLDNDRLLESALQLSEQKDYASAVPLFATLHLRDALDESNLQLYRTVRMEADLDQLIMVSAGREAGIEAGEFGELRDSIDFDAVRAEQPTVAVWTEVLVSYHAAGGGRSGRRAALPVLERAAELADHPTHQALRSWLLPADAKIRQPPPESFFAPGVTADDRVFASIALRRAVAVDLSVELLTTPEHDAISQRTAFARALSYLAAGSEQQAWDTLQSLRSTTRPNQHIERLFLITLIRMQRYADARQVLGDAAREFPAFANPDHPFASYAKLCMRHLDTPPDRLATFTHEVCALAERSDNPEIERFAALLLAKHVDPRAAVERLDRLRQDPELDPINREWCELTRLEVLAAAVEGKWREGRDEALRRVLDDGPAVAAALRMPGVRARALYAVARAEHETGLLRRALHSYGSSLLARRTDPAVIGQAAATVQFCWGVDLQAQGGEALRRQAMLSRQPLLELILENEIRGWPDERTKCIAANCAVLLSLYAKDPPGLRPVRRFVEQSIALEGPAGPWFPPALVAESADCLARWR